MQEHDASSILFLVSGLMTLTASAMLVSPCEPLLFQPELSWASRISIPSSCMVVRMLVLLVVEQKYSVAVLILRK
jgi:hypothetical protein